MQQPAIQAALNNLVEAIRTALMAEFVEYSRGDKAPVSNKRTPKGRKSAKKAARKAPSGKSAKKPAAKRAAK